MSPTQQAAMDILCTVISLGVAWACICRLAAGDATVWAAVRAHASLALGAALISAAAPWIGYPATVTQLMLISTIALGMVASVWRWRDGVDDGLWRSDSATADTSRSNA